METPSRTGLLKAPAAQPQPRVLQRKCACAACHDCEKKPMQRAATGPAPAVPESVTASMAQSVGQALPPDLRVSMESRFGRKFDSVRVFTDEHAATAARNANARAFTTGEGIYFAAGEYQPDSERGRELIAHELTHVAQQHAGRVTATGIGHANDAFEHEAERAAKAVTRGERPAVGMGGGGEKIRRATPKEAPQQIEMIVPTDIPLKVPRKKTINDKDGLLERYENAAKTGALRSTHAGRGLGLWSAWRKTRPFEVTTAEVEKRKTLGCQVDHMIELQAGGSDATDNLRLLKGEDNMSAGSSMSHSIEAVKQEVRKKKGLPEDTPLILVFSKAVLVGDPTKDPDCLEWELKESKGKGIKAPDADAETISAEISGSPGSIFAKAGSVMSISRYSVAGFRLVKATPKEKAWSLKGPVSEKVEKLPVLKPNKDGYDFEVATPGARVVLLGDKKLKAKFDHLSEVLLDMKVEGKKFIADGILKPTHPLLKYVDLTLHVEDDMLSVKAEVTPAKLKQALPIPGLEFTEAALALGYAAGSFTAKGGFSVKYTTIADAKLEALIDSKTGFVATGVLNLHIPGFADAKGKITYRDAALSGEVEITKLKIPGVKNPKLKVVIANGALSGDGTMDLSVPGVKKANVLFAVDPKGNFSISGTAALSIPGLKESSVALSYAENDLRGVARAGLAVPGLESAVFEVRYAKGNISGAGDIAFKKGKLGGKVHAELTEKHKLIGKGELAYDVFPGLVVAVGIELLETGKTIVSGEVRVPESITLFALRQYEKKLFSFGVQIPIFAIPLGTRSIGLVADIGADIKARAGVGPGQLRGVKAAATLDMSKPEASLEFLAKAELYIPAYADLRLAVHGGIGLSLAIASATGGIELAAILGVRGALSTPVQIQYKNNLFVVDAMAEILAQPVLKFDISAYVKVDLDLLLTTIEVYRKDWKLASREWGSGLTVGLRFPVHYEAGKPFNLSLDQLQFVKPEIDVMKAVKELLPH
jgi:Domain of unknown function (DUF4157)